MTYKIGVWRHENSIGNSAEHVINVAKAIKEKKEDVIVFVETDFQEHFARCIQQEIKIEYFPKELVEYKNNFNYNHEFFDDIHMPDCYPFKKTYPSTWSNLKNCSDITLKFDVENYENIYNLPKDAVVVQFREKSGYAKRHEGAESELERFVDPSTFHKLIKILLHQGHKVVRLGDSKQKSLDEHENLYDLAKNSNKSIKEDLFCLQTSCLFISSDSGIWPISGGFKKPLLLTNVTSPFRSNPPKMEIVDWLPKKTSQVMFKDKNSFKDNTLKEIYKEVLRFL